MAHIAAWKAQEDPVVARRAAKCKTTLDALLGAGPGPQPKVGICFSGGGWRAMASGVGTLDGLAVPLAAAETAQKVEGVKLLDTVQNAFGLSGGSWCLFTTLAGGERNPFHSAEPAGPGGRAPAADDRANHPWIHGHRNHFNANTHLYSGLRAIVNRDRVNAACYRSATRQRLVNVTASLGADPTLGTVLVTGLLGDSLVERWSTFLANDILNFKDGKALAEALVEDQAAEGQDSTLKSKDDPNRSNPSRDVKLSSLKTLVEAGDFPFVVCSAIADRVPDAAPAQDAGPGAAKRMYDWVEYSPYFVRNPSRQICSGAVDDIDAHFSPVDKEKGLAAHKLRVHHFMGICGSAFACDLTAIVGPSAAAVIDKRISVGSNPVLGKGLSDLTTKEGAEFGCCRDAGIDFNVPLPPMLAGAGRGLDILIVMDAGAGSKNAGELKRAVELGYLVLDPGEPNPADKLKSRVQVYRGLGGHPTVIYFLGLTDRPTSQISHHDAMICEDVDLVRESVLKDLAPVLLAELKLTKQQLSTGQRVAGPPAGAQAAPVAHVSAAAVRTVDMQIALEEDDLDHLKDAAVAKAAAAKAKIGGALGGLFGKKK